MPIIVHSYANIEDVSQAGDQPLPTRPPTADDEVSEDVSSDDEDDFDDDYDDKWTPASLKDVKGLQGRVEYLEHENWALRKKAQEAKTGFETTRLTLCEMGVKLTELMISTSESINSFETKLEEYEQRNKALEEEINQLTGKLRDVKESNTQEIKKKINKSEKFMKKFAVKQIHQEASDLKSDIKAVNGYVGSVHRANQKKIDRLSTNVSDVTDDVRTLEKRLHSMVFIPSSKKTGHAK